MMEADSLGQLTFEQTRLLAELHGSYGDQDAALAAFDKAADMNPTSARVRQQRGASKANMKDFNGAIEDLTAAIELAPSNSSSYRYRGKVNYLA